MIFGFYVTMLTWTCLFSSTFQLEIVKSILYKTPSNDDVTLLTVQLLTIFFINRILIFWRMENDDIFHAIEANSESVGVYFVDKLASWSD